MNPGSSRFRWTVAGIALLLVIAACFYWGRSGDASGYVIAEVTRGPVVRAVSATGAVNPVSTVQVGTYVSGPIEAIYADFNSRVKAGERIAKIDARPFQMRVEAARAALAHARAQLGRSEADLAYKKSNYERVQQLATERAVSEDAVDAARSAYQQAVAQIELDKATIGQAQANLKDAEINLGYTDIVSPVDGIVVSRNVDVGQTVAASFQTPTLFLIAKDLTRMLVHANVSEADIGEVREGQRASFTVDAYPGREFSGMITSVRNAPATVQNVVTYDVVIAVENPQLLLKPGMTANVTIVTARRDDAVRLPVEALRFVPNGVAPSGRATASEPGAHVWVPSGRALKAVAVKTGLDDGRWVELLGGDLKPGDVIVIGERRAPQVPMRGPRIF